MKHTALIPILWASALLAGQIDVATTPPIDNWCVFKDAFGNPIPEADVAVFRDIKWSDETSKLLEISKLDKFGRLKPPSQDPNLYKCCFIVSHPDYGLALAEPRLYSLYSKQSDLLTECIVPLVRIDSEVYKRSIFGFVTDTSGNPVTGAIITCSGVLTVDRARLVQDEPYYWNLFRAITDAQGHFTFYMPITNQGTLIPIPPGAKYNVIIIPPKGLELSTLSTLLTSGKEAFIKLRSLIPSPKPQFIFEDEFGPVTDPNMLQQVRLEFVGEGSLRCKYVFTHWLQRGDFEQGTYHATADWNGKHYIFEPVHLTVDDVNETVVFKPAEILPLETTYRGQVIHGVTGQPISDALVMKHPTIDDFNLSDIDEDEHVWISKAMLQIGPEFGPDDGLFELLKEDFKSKMIMRTSADGRFQIALPKGEIAPLHSIIAVKKDFLGAQQELYNINIPVDQNSPSRQDLFVPDQDGYVTIPPLKLFPAATIIIELNLPVGSRIRRIRLNWFNFPGDKPTWFDAMGDYTYAVKNAGASLLYKKDLLSNMKQKVYVAVDLEMDLQLTVPGENQWDRIIIPNVKLQAGEVLDIGKVEFGPALKVMVLVVDSAGKPVEGITVRQFNEKGYYQGRQGITDIDGIAFLDIPRYSTGEFAVEKQLGRAPDGLWQEPLTEGVSYKVAGEQDNGKVFILQLSDDFLKILFE